MIRVVAAAVIVCSAFASSVRAQSADAIQKRLDAEAVEVRAWTVDQALVEAVTAHNALKLSAAEIQRREAAWANASGPLVVSVTTGACADRLRALRATAPKYGEILLMDDQGALVCATNRTSDYFQGDEPKFLRAWAEGEGAVFIDRPRLDDSSSERLAQISLPVKDGAKTIGVLTVGVRLDALMK